jgi:hypothetical protein
MRPIRPEYEFPIEGRAWTQGALPTAGVYLLGGDCHIVARQGPAALELESRGALLFALVRFDADPRETAAAGRAIRPLDLREAVARFASPEAAGDQRPASRFTGGFAPDRDDPDADP